MNRPWMPLYIADYLRDTANLRALHSGAYLHLIMAYWVGGNLPNDDKQLATIARMTDREWANARPILAKFFGENWTHKRIDDELARAADISNKRRASAMQRGSKQDAIDDTLHISQLPREDRKKDIGSVARATRPPLNADFLKFKESYPKRDGPNPWTPAEKLFLAAIKSGYVAGDIIAGAARYHAEADRLKYTGTERVAQAKTWLNQARWQDYAPTTNGAAPTGFTLTENTPQQWDAWRADLVAGGADVRFMDAQREKGGAYRVLTEWPPDIPKAEAAE